MKSNQLREEFLNFYKNKEHTVVPSSSLIPSDDSVLFTTAGMQQFKDYYLDKKSPYGNKVTSSQKCFRTSDIEEVGDKDHLTLLEMLGNFSFGDYFKEETIKWALQFLTENCNLSMDRLIFTYFKGDGEVPTDNESKEIWKSLGAKENQIIALGMEDNFWGPTGNSGPCGPTTEIHYDLTGKKCEKKDCGLECSCGRYVEIWNLVFNEYFKDEDGNLSKLKKQGVDTGMGLERLAMSAQGKLNLFDTDIFVELKETIENLSDLKLEKRGVRIIADHIRGATFLISEGIEPSNTERGYILRRLLRRSMRYRKLLLLPEDSLEKVAEKVLEIYDGIYLNKNEKNKIFEVIRMEQEKFERALDNGLKEFEKTAKGKTLKGKVAFQIYSTYGFPVEMIEELCQEKGIIFTKEEFEKAIKDHKEISRRGAQEKFGGLSKNPEKEEIKLHTATHLLQESLKKILGNHIHQEGSDITPERLRFDFSHPDKLTSEELKKVEDMVNWAIEKNLIRKIDEMSYDEAINKGALSFGSKEEYPDRVTVYSFWDNNKVFSMELCGGPHVEKTSELGRFKIQSEKSSSKGIRRIKAILY